MFQPFGPWAEWACLAAIDTLALACLAAASALPRERWAGGVLVFAAGFLLPFFFSATPTGSYAAQYVNAMADLPLAMLFGGTLCLYFAVGRCKIAYWLVALPATTDQSGKVHDNGRHLAGNRRGCTSRSR